MLLSVLGEEDELAVKVCARSHPEWLIFNGRRSVRVSPIKATTNLNVVLVLLDAICDHREKAAVKRMVSPHGDKTPVRAVSAKVIDVPRRVF